MKWLKISFLVILILLTSIKSYPQALLKKSRLNENKVNIKVMDKIYKYKNNYLDINVIIPQLTGISNKNQEELVNNKIIQSTENWINEVEEIADEYFKDKIAPSIPYQLYARYKVTNNSGIISFYIDYYQFSGGAHGITNRVAYNIEEKTGMELQLKDIFKSDYKEIINKEISRQISKEPDRYFSGKDGFNGINDNQNFYIENNKVVIYFGVYEIAPYSSGISEFIIPSKLIEEIFRYDKI